MQTGASPWPPCMLKSMMNCSPSLQQETDRSSRTQIAISRNTNSNSHRNKYLVNLVILKSFLTQRILSSSKISKYNFWGSSLGGKKNMKIWKFHRTLGLYGSHKISMEGGGIPFSFKTGWKSNCLLMWSQSFLLCLNQGKGKDKRWHLETRKKDPVPYSSLAGQGTNFYDAIPHL